MNEHDIPVDYMVCFPWYNSSQKKPHVDTIVQQYLNISMSKIPHFLTNETSMEKRTYFTQYNIGLLHGLCLVGFS